MTELNELAGSLTFEDLEQADLFDYVVQPYAKLGMEPEAPDNGILDDRSPSPDCLMDTDDKYTSITLINGEQICLREDFRQLQQEDWMDPDQDMDLNSVLQAGVVERVAPSSTRQHLGDLQWQPGVPGNKRPIIETRIINSELKTGNNLVTSVSKRSVLMKVDPPSVKPFQKPRATILASQLPLPVPSCKLVERRKDLRTNTVIISTNEKVQASEVAAQSNNNNNNSLLRSALTTSQANGSEIVLTTPQSTPKRALIVKTEDNKVDDILLLSLEGGEAVARFKDGNGASQLFPNTRVSRDTPASNIISIEVDVSGNLVLHKTTSSPPQPSLSPELNTDITESTNILSMDASQLATVRKYHRRPKEEPKKESRLLHYCHVCNKGFKDKYSVNVHVRTHTGEKPFSCSLCGKCFRQKAHLAKHQQTHATKQEPGTGVSVTLDNLDEF